MCNAMHKENYVVISNKPSVTEGIGYKLFTTGGATLYGMVSHIKYSTDENGVVRWNPFEMHPVDRKTIRAQGVNENEECGFCILPTEEEALRLKRAWNSSFGSCDALVFKVRYRRAIAAHDETNILAGLVFSIVLVQEFELHEDEINRGWHF